MEKERKRKLPFGVPLEQVCHDGTFHPRLKELFLLALSSVADDANVIGRHHAVLSALRGGPRGLGSLSTRLALKNVLESGKGFDSESFLKSLNRFPKIQAQETEPTPPGAALWLLRVFLGRLPLPLLIGTRWRQLGKQCSVASRRTCATSTFGSTSNIQLLNAAAKCLQSSSLAEKTLLKALLQLMSNLGGGGPALLALADFFAPSLVGTTGTTVRFADEALQCVRSLLLFLSCHWTEIFSLLGDDDQNYPLFCEDVACDGNGSYSQSQPSLLKSSFGSEFGDERASSVTLGRKSVSWTDTRGKQPIVRRIFKLYDAGDKRLVVASSSKTTGRTPPDQTPLLRNSDTEVEENKAFPLKKMSRESGEEDLAIRMESPSKERSQSRCWLKSLFGNRGASMSHIPSATAVKYEPIADKKKTWTL